MTIDSMSIPFDLLIYGCRNFLNSKEAKVQYILSLLHRDVLLEPVQMQDGFIRLLWICRSQTVL